MTIRELRSILTEVDNQELTVKELRDILYNVEDQDKEVDRFTIYDLTREVK